MSQYQLVNMCMLSVALMCTLVSRWAWSWVAIWRLLITIRCVPKKSSLWCPLIMGGPGNWKYEREVAQSNACGDGHNASSDSFQSLCAFSPSWACRRPDPDLTGVRVRPRVLVRAILMAAAGASWTRRAAPMQLAVLAETCTAGLWRYNSAST